MQTRGLFFKPRFTGLTAFKPGYPSLTYGGSLVSGRLANRGSSLKTVPARPGHAKIALDITTVEFDQFSLYSTGTMIMYDRLSL